MDDEFECAERVCDAFEVVALPMSEVVHWVGIPAVACADMWDVENAVDDGVTEVHIGVGHVNFGTEDHFAWFHVSAVHVVEELEAFFDGSVAIRALDTRLGWCAFLFGYFLGSLLVNIGATLFNKVYGEVPELLEIVGGVEDVAPFETEPLDVLLYGLDVLMALLDRVSVVETEITDTAVSLGDAEVESYGFGVTDVKVAIGFGRETSLDASTIFAVAKIFLDLLYDEVALSFGTFLGVSDIVSLHRLE